MEHRSKVRVAMDHRAAVPDRVTINSKRWEKNAA
jgi:hypothetical protein